jgi:hypothetical protein
MSQLLKWGAPILAATAVAPACAAPVEREEQASAPFRPAADNRQEGNVTNDSTSISRRYRTLDDYLAFLESRAPIDGHWYREIRPGVYRLETGNYRGPEVEQRIFTREELERKFGYSPR